MRPLLNNKGKILTKTALWADLEKINKDSLHKHNPSFSDCDYTSDSVWIKQTDSNRICNDCKGYSPLECIACHDYVEFLARIAKNPIILLNRLRDLKQYHIDRMNNLFTQEDYLRD